MDFVDRRDCGPAAIHPSLLVRTNAATARVRWPAAQRMTNETKSAPAPAEGHDLRSGLDPSNLIGLTYRLILGRDVEPATLRERVDGLNAGISFAEMFLEIANSDEALRRNRVDDPSRELLGTIVVSAYEHVLRRTPKDHEVEHWVKQLQAELSVQRFFELLVASEEAKRLSPGPLLGSRLSDGEFVLRSSPLLFGRGLAPQEVVVCQNLIDEVPAKRVEFAFNMINDRLRESLAGGHDDLPNDPATCEIMGTTRRLTLQGWNARRRDIAAMKRENGHGKPLPISDQRPFEHTGSYRVSMIASLYRGGRYIRQFLDNITSQSLFGSAELVIIDANSPEFEHEIIEEYQTRFPNIIYKRVNYRIGIYEAWNVAIEIARGRYITNTNLDDLRRRDSIELQAAVLDKNDDVDVAYQDFFYTLEPSLSFDEVAECGFQSELPIVTGHNLLSFNSPHNAPMWRASLHEELGLFDTRYRSAGDHEFWARCLSQGKTFRKINAPHVVYYQNPEGVSTRPNTRGIEEGRDVIRRYGEKLISPALLQSRRDFRFSLGMDATDEGLPASTPYYDIAQVALRRLGASRSKTPSLTTQR